MEIPPTSEGYPKKTCLFPTYGRDETPRLQGETESNLTCIQQSRERESGIARVNSVPVGIGVMGATPATAVLPRLLPRMEFDLAF